MKVSELNSPELDYWVAKGEGWIEERFISRGGERMLSLGDPEREQGKYRGHFLKEGTQWVQHTYSPSTDWSQGGPIIEREGIDLECVTIGNHWAATTYGGIVVRGKTPLIAVMRAYVSSKFGEEVAETGTEERSTAGT